MFDLKDLQFLAALARHGHFAKAAAECGVSQPAFSMRIRAMEERLNTSIVRRGNRFQGLTAEGEAIVRHGRKVLDDMRVLQQEVLSARGEITGNVALAAIPTATATAARLALHLYRRHPGILVRTQTDTSLGIQQRLEGGTIDAGVTYGDSVSGDLFTIDPLYDETYVLLAPAGMAPRAEGEISWREVAGLPLVLLDPGMQNRRILDRVFADLGVQPTVISETSALMTAVVMACEGVAATILPETVPASLGPLAGTVVLSIVDPTVAKAICLVTTSRSPRLPTVEALRKVAASS